MNDNKLEGKTLAKPLAKATKYSSENGPSSQSQGDNKKMWVVYRIQCDSVNNGAAAAASLLGLSIKRQDEK